MDFEVFNINLIFNAEKYRKIVIKGKVIRLLTPYFFPIFRFKPIKKTRSEFDERQIGYWFLERKGF
jgi:hypothetical protein